MAKVNTVQKGKVATHEGGIAQQVSPLLELRRSVLTCLLWEETFYEKGSDIAERISELVKLNEPEDVANLAIEARSKMYLRHVPLLLVRELARKKGNGKLIASTLPLIIQRADELTEFLAIYWKDKRQSLSSGVKRGLAQAFIQFSEYELAKYNRNEKVKLRDVLFLCHAKPKDEKQANLWIRLIDDKLVIPDTWETELSAGKDKKATFERLLREKKLGGLACLRNLRNMEEAGVDQKLIEERLSQGIKRALPFRFLVAATYAPRLEVAIELAMFKAMEGVEKLSGSTGLLIDISGSMEDPISERSETSRWQAAAGLAILLRERCDNVEIATFSDQVILLPPRRGMALKDAINQSQGHGGTYLYHALETLHQKAPNWLNLDRMIVITDEQAHDGIYSAWIKKSYVINVAPYKNGLSYGNGWRHIDGWSERIFDYINLVEQMNVKK